MKRSDLLEHGFVFKFLACEAGGLVLGNCSIVQVFLELNGVLVIMYEAYWTRAIGETGEKEKMKGREREEKCNKAPEIEFSTFFQDLQLHRLLTFSLR